MNEIKCPECGSVINADVEICPTCGFPVKKSDEQKIITEKEKKHFNVLSLIALLIGVVIIIIGGYTATRKADLKIHSAKKYNTDIAAFGADFYTEIYDATKAAADGVWDVNSGIEIISKDMSSIANTIYFSAGMIIIAIGSAIVAVSIKNIK